MTNTIRFEQQYPVNSRQKEISQILQFVTRGQSCQLISVPGAGRSTVIRLLAFHPKLVGYQLASLKGMGIAASIVKRYGYTSDQNKIYTSSDTKNHNQTPLLFVYANFAEVPSFDTNQELIKFLFLAILSSIREFPHLGGGRLARRSLGEAGMDSPEVNPVNLGKEIYAIFKEALSVGDPLVMSQSLKRAIAQLNSRVMVPIFLFDRFSEFSHKIPPDFYASLYSLRAGGGKIPIVFSTHRPLKELLPPDILQKFDQFFVDNLVYLEAFDEVTNNTRITILEKEYGKKLPLKTRDELIKLTGGHGKLTKLATQILLTEDGSSLARSDLARLLLEHTLIKNSLLEIWQSLITKERDFLRETANGVGIAASIDRGHSHTPDKNVNPYEQQNRLTSHLTFPLFIEFIKLGLPQTLLPKTIRFDQTSNEIYFGDQALSDLTAQEFKLLKFLINNPHRVVERDEVIQAVWTDSKTQAGVSDEALDQMVYRLRRKIEDEADNPKHLLTVKGRGFRFLPSLPINNP